MLELVSKNAQWIVRASDYLRNDKTFVLRAVQIDGRVFSWVEEALKADRDFVLKEVAKRSCYGFFGVSKVLLSDREFVFEAVRSSRYALGRATDELCADQEVVIEAIKHDGDAFQYAAASLQGDRDFVLRVVSHNGCALRHASEVLKRDITLLDEVIKAKINNESIQEWPKGKDEYLSQKNSWIARMHTDCLCIRLCIREYVICVYYLVIVKRLNVF